MSIWILAAIGVAAMATLAVLSNRATSRKAFLAGYLSHSKQPSEILEAYKSYLSPMRPLDAAAFRKGLEYAASSPNVDIASDQFRNEFKRIYKTGVLTKEGTEIRHMGKETAADLFQRKLERGTQRHAA